MAIDWKRPVECDDYGLATKVVEGFDFARVYFADGLSWNYNGSGEWLGDFDNQLMMLRNVTEMAGLTGFAIITKDQRVCGVFENQESALKHYLPGQERVIDLSKVPASAIVKPPPKRETRKVWMAMWSNGDISQVSGPVAESLARDSICLHPVAIVEREIEFAHGEGINKDR